jgi:hypothetical protein
VKRALLVVVVLVAAGALADVLVRDSNGTTVGPVTSINAKPDGGINITRPTGTSKAMVECTEASATEKGCSRTVRYGTCPETQARWLVSGARYDGGTAMGYFEALDPSGGRIDNLILFDSGGAQTSDAGSVQASFLLVIQ